MTSPYPPSPEMVKSLSEADADNLQWALDFMKRYEKRKKNEKPVGRLDE